MKTEFLISALFFTTASYGQYGKNAVDSGSKAPEIIAESPNGQLLSLSEINKGRYVLLDFYATGCVGCRLLSPKFREIYRKYSSRQFKNAPNGFTIVSFSNDNNREKWMKTITEDSLSWVFHFSDFKAFKSPFNYKYGIIGIPTFFLIDPSGIIIGKYDHDVAKMEDELKKYLK